MGMLQVRGWPHSAPPEGHPLFVSPKTCTRPPTPARDAAGSPSARRTSVTVTPSARDSTAAARTTRGTVGPVSTRGQGFGVSLPPAEGARVGPEPLQAPGQSPGCPHPTELLFLSVPQVGKGPRTELEPAVSEEGQNLPQVPPPCSSGCHPLASSAVPSLEPGDAGTGSCRQEPAGFASPSHLKRGKWGGE